MPFQSSFPRLYWDFRWQLSGGPMRLDEHVQDQLVFQSYSQLMARLRDRLHNNVWYLVRSPVWRQVHNRVWDRAIDERWQ